MTQLTYDDAIAALVEYAPEGDFDLHFLAALERLGDEEWAGNKDKVTLSVQANGIFTLPREYSTALGIKVSGIVRILEGQWYEFAPGVNESQQSFGTAVSRIGTGFCVFKDPPTAQKLRVECAAFSGDFSTTIAFGRDQNGNAVYTDVMVGSNVDKKPGEHLEMNTTGTVLFSSISGILLPVTQAPKYLYCVDSFGAQTLIGQYAPGETRPNYARYKVQETLNSGDPLTVDVLCVRQFVKPVAGEDYIYPSHLQALASAMLWSHYRSAGDLMRAESHYNDALKMLGKQIVKTHAPGESIVRVRNVGQGMGQGFPTLY